ncbi:hypothetical protein ACSQ67_014788 [Phaseolus vulgaris]
MKLISSAPSAFHKVEISTANKAFPLSSLPPHNFHSLPSVEPNPNTLTNHFPVSNLPRIHRKHFVSLNFVSRQCFETNLEWGFKFAFSLSVNAVG